MANVKGYTYRKGGKLITVRPHVRASRGGGGESLAFLRHEFASQINRPFYARSQKKTQALAHRINAAEKQVRSGGKRSRGSLGNLTHSPPRRSRLRSYNQLGGGEITSAKFWLSSGHSPAQAAHKVRSGESGMKKKVAAARKKHPHLSESQIRQDLHRYGHVAKWR